MRDHVSLPLIKVANSNLHLTRVLLWSMAEGQGLLFSIEGGLFWVSFGHSTMHFVFSFTLVIRILS